MNGDGVRITEIPPGEVPHALTSALLEGLPEPRAVVNLDGTGEIVALWEDRWRCDCGAGGGWLWTEGTLSDAVAHLLTHRRPTWRERLFKIITHG